MLCTQSCPHGLVTLVTPWTIARQAFLSMDFSRQEYWSGLPFPSTGDLSGTGIEPVTLVFPALTGRFFTTTASWEVRSLGYLYIKEKPDKLN